MLPMNALRLRNAASSSLVVVTGAPQLVSMTANPNTTTVAYPSGLQNGDVAILFVAVDTTGGGTVTDPAGFTQIQTASMLPGQRFVAWWKRLTGTETGNIAVSFTVGTGVNNTSVCLAIYRGCVSTGTPVEDSGWITQGTSTGWTGTGTRNIANPDRTLVHCYNLNRSTATITPDTGYTADASITTTGGAATRTAMHHRYLTVPRDVAETAALSASSGWGSIFFSLIPQTVVSSTTPYANDPFWTDTKLLCGFEGAIADESPVARALTANGNAQSSSALFKWGAASALFDGTGDYITAPDSADWNIASGPVTVETFARFTVKQTSQAIIGQWDNAGTTSNCAWFLYITGGNLTFRVTNGSTTIDCAVAWTPTLGQWYHIAVSRNIFGKTRLFIGGVMVASVTTQNLSVPDSTNVLSIGRIGTATTFSSFDFQGNLDELRVTKGKARYDSDAGFTVPSAAFPRA
jgi:hypothetical protein